MSDTKGWRLVHYAADTTAERLQLKQAIEKQNGPDTSELIWAADESSPDFGLRIVRPRTKHDYYYEGTLQSNCISGDQIDAYNHYPIVYSVRDENNLPLVSYEARYVPLTDFQQSAEDRDEFFGHREHEDPEDHHYWKGPQDGLGVLMTRQVCSVGNHVPGEDKLRSFLNANISHMKQRGLSYMQYITAEGEHQPGVCQEGCPSNERESLSSNPLLSLADLEAIATSHDRKIAPGTPIYIAAPFYAVNEQGEINAAEHKGKISILPVGPAFARKSSSKTAQVADDVEVDVEGKKIRIPRDMQIIRVPFNEKQIRSNDRLGDALLQRNGGGGGLTLTPDAVFKYPRERDVIFKPKPQFLAVDSGELSAGADTPSTYDGPLCYHCLPENRRNLRVHSGSFVYEGEEEQFKDKFLVPVTEEDINGKFVRDENDDRKFRFNDLNSSIFPMDRVMRPRSGIGSEEQPSFTSIENGTAKAAYSHIPDNPMEHPGDPEGSGTLAKSAYGLVGDPEQFAPEQGLFGSSSSLNFVDSWQTLNHQRRRDKKWRPLKWLIKTGADSFHHASALANFERTGDKDDKGNLLDEEFRCGTQNAQGVVEGGCGIDHLAFAPARKSGVCKEYDGHCSTNTGIQLKDLIYMGVDHEYEPSKRSANSPCRHCGQVKFRNLEERDRETGEMKVVGQEDAHGAPIYMEEPHVLWDSDSKTWKKNANGGKKVMIQSGQDLGAEDFHLVPNADEHLNTIHVREDDDGLPYLPSNIGHNHTNISAAAHQDGERGVVGHIPLTQYITPGRRLVPGPLYNYGEEARLTPESNPELFSTSPDYKGAVFINPESIEMKLRQDSTEWNDDNIVYSLKQETSSPLRPPKLYFKAPISSFSNASIDQMTDEGNVDASILQLFTEEQLGDPGTPTAVGEVDVAKMSSPEFTCGKCGSIATLDSSENPDDKKANFKVHCSECSPQWLQCGRNHRLDYKKVKAGENSDTDSPITFMGMTGEGPVGTCDKCEDRCPTCDSFGWVLPESKEDANQPSLFGDSETKMSPQQLRQLRIDVDETERGRAMKAIRPSSAQTCSNCNGDKYLRGGKQQLKIVSDTVRGNKRGTLGLITADHIGIADNGRASIISPDYPIFDEDGRGNRNRKIPKSLLKGVRVGAGVSKGVQIWFNELGKGWHDVRQEPQQREASIKEAAGDDQLMQLRDAITQEDHEICGENWGGRYCDGEPHKDIQERTLWKNDTHSLQHILNEDAHWVEGEMMRNCIGGLHMGEYPNIVSLRNENNIPKAMGHMRVIGKDDWDSSGAYSNATTATLHDLKYLQPKGTFPKEINSDDSSEENHRVLPDGSATLIDPLFSTDTWSREIIDKEGNRVKHPHPGVLTTQEMVGYNNNYINEEDLLPFLKGIHGIMTDRGIDYFNYSVNSGRLFTRDEISSLIDRFDMGQNLKGKDVYIQVPISNSDPRVPNVIIPDSRSRILPVGEAFDVAKR